MEKVLFLGSYGFYNFGDELCLIESMRMYPHAQHWVHSADPAYTSRCTGITNFIHKRFDCQAIKPDVVVIGGGGVGFLPSIRDHLHWAMDAVKLGAKLRIHNIGVAHTTIEDKSWLIPTIVDLINKAQEFSVRDQISYEIARQWTGREPAITQYPEVNMDMPYFSELDHLPTGRKLLGISVTNQQLTREALQRSGASMIEALEPFQDHVVVPVVSCLHKDTQEEDDIDGFNFFRSLFLQNFEVVEDIFANTDYIRSFYTPQFIRALVGKMDVLFSQRKHNCIHAIGAGTPVVGFSSHIDDSIKRVFDECSVRLPKGSKLLQL